MSVPANAIQGSIAFRQAVEDAGNAVDQMMMQYGWQTPGAGGQYSSIAAGDAYDPDKVLSFDDQGKAVMTMPTVGGQYGTTGLFAQSAQETAAEEAQARLGMRASGITGGLARQREVLSESLGRERMGALSGQLFAGLGQQYGGVRTSYGNLLAAQVEDATTAGTGMAENVTLTDPNVAVPPPDPAAGPPVDTGPRYSIGNQTYGVGDIVPDTANGRRAFRKKGDPGGKPPGNPQNGEIYMGPGGVWWVRRNQGPKGPGWYKK